MRCGRDNGTAKRRREDVSGGFESPSPGPGVSFPGTEDRTRGNPAIYVGVDGLDPLGLNRSWRFFFPVVLILCGGVWF